MGIGRQQFIDVALPALRAGTNTRAKLRKQVAGLVTAGQEWLAKFDEQELGASAGFAASRPSQFQSFVDALPDITIGATDPGDAVP